MAADTPHRAPNVCNICKLRKKRCDKTLPRCGYCRRQSLDCRYTIPPAPRARGRVRVSAQSPPTPPASHASPYTASPIQFPSRPLLCSPLTSASASDNDPRLNSWNEAVHSEAYRLIRETGRFFDDVTVAYFASVHVFVPLISREQFHRHLFSFGASPVPDVGDFSLLLLVVGLITYHPARAQAQAAAGNIDLPTLYLTAKSLFAQAQVLLTSTPSLYLIQAGLLLAVFEYAHGNPDLALVTITGVARLALVAGLDAGLSPDVALSASASDNGNANLDQDLELAEKINTWWGIVICERTFLSESRNPTQPRLSQFPADDTPLPVESMAGTASSAISIPLCFTTAPNLGGFARTAQAAWLLDRVLNVIPLPNSEPKRIQLSDLDSQLRLFLAQVIAQKENNHNIYCASLALGIRALFILHCHIIHLFSDTDPDPDQDPATSITSEIINRSNAALTSATQMVVDIAMSHQELSDHQIDTLPPLCGYLMREALTHVHVLARDRNGHRDLLQATVDRLASRWNMSWSVALR
ncbi:hypothetical protein BDW74DRAFT_177652 [Aspergillus multicolor]|uniref:uncharacterized protein n=1 Tax=Aspergillus multicolor TaxID=41759 RepID=UPI003CCDBC24